MRKLYQYSQLIKILGGAKVLPYQAFTACSFLKKNWFIVLFVVCFFNSCAVSTRVPKMSEYLTLNEFDTLEVVNRAKERRIIVSKEKIDSIITMLHQYSDANLGKTPHKFTLIFRNNTREISLFPFNKTVSIQQKIYSYKFNIEEELNVLVFGDK